MATENNPKLEYLDQGYVAKRDKQTFALQFALSTPSPNDKTPVLCIHGQFSRFILTLIDNTTSNRNILKVNIRADEVPHLFRQYELASAAKFGYKTNPKAAKENAKDRCPAFDTKIRAGVLKDKTPGEILMEDPSKANELARHRQWLSEHVTQYPKNEEVIVAIDDAMFLMNTNQLASKAASCSSGNSSTSVTIFKEDFKYMSSGTSEPNMKTGVKVHITSEFEDAFPWKFYIENNDVPFANGKPSWNQAKNKRSGVVRLTDMEMDCLIYRMRALMQLFESHVFAEAYKFVQENQNAWRHQQDAPVQEAAPRQQNVVPYPQNGYGGQQPRQNWNNGYSAVPNQQPNTRPNPQNYGQGRQGQVQYQGQQFPQQTPAQYPVQQNVPQQWNGYGYNQPQYG